MPISPVWILKYVQQCYVKWFWTISSLGAPNGSRLLGKNILCLKTSKRVFSNWKHEACRLIF